MRKALTKIFKEILIIFMTTILMVVLVETFFELGPESTMTGWVETYLVWLFSSILMIFIFEKDLLIKHKIIGITLVFSVSLGIFYLWFIFKDSDFSWFTFIFGHLAILVIVKHLVLKFLPNAKLKNMGL
ncbi:MAG: hypothetical protein JJU02_11125 [Cryomorphaceae bacterium]|nr:hypothetical protein [Cryomorphaceae bacterium]